MITNYGPTDMMANEIDTPLESIAQDNEVPDDSSVFEVLDQDLEKDEGRNNFYSNIAEDIYSAKLNTLAYDLIEEIENDKASRLDWERTINVALKYLGYEVEEFTTVPFMRACSAFDSTMSISTIRFCATARAELFPAAGPVRTEIFGTPTDEVEDQADRVKLFMNFYLTGLDKEYYPDSERLLLYTCFFGSCFRKVYQDPILNRPLARMIPSQKLIVDINCTSLLSSNRITHEMELTKREIKLRENSGEFLDSNLPDVADQENSKDEVISKTIDKMSGINKDTQDNKSLFTFYECHVNLVSSDLYENNEDDEEEIPKPYIVTICKDSKKIVSIKRNWDEGDKTFKRIECFIHHYFLPGFGIYGFGYAHLLGSNAITATSTLRQSIDAASLKNFPGGLVKKGIQMENNDKAVGPSEFIPINADGPIQDNIMLMPYGEPSQALIQLRNEIIQQMQSLIGATETQIADIGANAPVGTTLAILEVANKVQSSILRTLHVSLGHEFQLLFKLFGQYWGDDPYPFSVSGKDSSVMKADFNNKINILPVSDPNVLTSTHRLILNESIMKLAQMAPDMHDMREIFKRIYTSMNVQDIDKILPEPPKPIALDALTENFLITLGKPVTVLNFQDDESHIICHEQQMNQEQFVQANPQIKSMFGIHIQQHKAYKALKEIISQNQQQYQMLYPQVQQIQKAQMMGIPIRPEFAQIIQQFQQIQQNLMSYSQQIEQIPIDQIQEIPQIQNMVVKQDAERIQQQIAQQQAMMQEQSQQQIDPNAVMMADIEQRREASILKEEEAKLRAETEAFKAQLKHESEMAKIESQKNIAEQKNETDLVIEEMKHSNEVIG